MTAFAFLVFAEPEKPRLRRERSRTILARLGAREI